MNKFIFFLIGMWPLFSFSGPNTWTNATVKNELGDRIFNVKFYHRYDNDHHDDTTYDFIDNDLEGETMRVGYWTGFGRTGKDFWDISFELDGKIYNCKDDFSCFLRSNDAEQKVVCRLFRDNGGISMHVDCPNSGDCNVSLSSETSNPNTWTKATIKNELGVRIYNIEFKHRYDDDHNENTKYSYLDNGIQGEPMDIGYWTGLGRTGSDYWYISFDFEGIRYSCKDDFYCFLRDNDANQLVVCKIYKEGADLKMYVDCPNSGDCVVSLNSEVAIPNSSAKVQVLNNFGTNITNVQMNHRYDNDHYDAYHYNLLSNEETGEQFNIGFWTGLGRTGKDYWLITFEAEGKIWTCKDNFYCYLTDADVGGTITCRLYKDGNEGKMEIICPQSNGCIVSLEGSSLFNPANGRPIYLIGHRCNDGEDIGMALNGGCNGIECDLQYDPVTDEIYVNHDFASGISLNGWLNNAKVVSTQYGEQFSLIIFDCKFVTKFSPITSQIILLRVREKIREILNNTENPINVVFSISSLDNKSAFLLIKNDLKENEGIAIDEYDFPDQVQSFYQSNNINNCWYGNGIATVGPGDFIPSVRNGCELRQQNKILKKVYIWTLAKEESIRKFIEEVEVDGVFINVPGTIDGISPTGLDEALKVIRHSTKVRMARKSDDAFATY